MFRRQYGDHFGGCTCPLTKLEQKLVLKYKHRIDALPIVLFFVHLLKGLLEHELNQLTRQMNAAKNEDHGTTELRPMIKSVRETIQNRKSQNRANGGERTRLRRVDVMRANRFSMVSHQSQH